MLDVRNKQDLALSKQWLSNLLSVMGQKACWAVPRSGTMVMIDKESKTADIHYGVEDDSLRVVFEELGYKCNILPNN